MSSSKILQNLSNRDKQTKYNQSFLNDWVQKTSIVPNSEPIVLKKKKKKELPIPPSLLKLISKTVPKFGRSLTKTVPLRSRPSSAAEFIESRSTPTPTPTPTPQNIVKTDSSVTVSFDAKINKKGQNQRADRPCPLSKKPKSVSGSSTSGSSVKSPAAESNPSTTSSRIPIYDRNCSASRLTDEDDLKSSKTKTSSSSSDSVNLHLARLISLMTCKKCKRILRPNRIVKCLNCHFYCKECKGGKDENSFGDYCQHCRERRKIRPSKPLTETHLQLEAANDFIEKCGLCSDKYYNLGNGKIEHLANYCRKNPKNFVFRSA
jgi:hypothetical protein